MHNILTIAVTLVFLPLSQCQCKFQLKKIVKFNVMSKDECGRSSSSFPEDPVSSGIFVH